MVLTARLASSSGEPTTAQCNNGGSIRVTVAAEGEGPNARVVRGSNPFGRTFYQKSSSAALATKSERADRTPDGQQDGSTTRRRAGLDVAASAAAVRSEAEDEPRSREQSACATIVIAVTAGVDYSHDRLAWTMRKVEVERFRAAPAVVSVSMTDETGHILNDLYIRLEETANLTKRRRCPETIPLWR